MQVCRKVFSYTTQNSYDKNVPVEMVMKELNETIPAESIISIQEERHVGSYEYDRIGLFDRSSSSGHCPHTTTLVVFYRA